MLIFAYDLRSRMFFSSKVQGAQFEFQSFGATWSNRMLILWKMITLSSLNGLWRSPII